MCWFQPLDTAYNYKVNFVFRQFILYIHDGLKLIILFCPALLQLHSHPFITQYEDAKVDLARFVRSVFDPTQRMKDLADVSVFLSLYYLSWHYILILFHYCASKKHKTMSGHWLECEVSLSIGYLMIMR